LKLVSYERKGVRGYGAVVDGGIVELGPKLGTRYSDLRAALAGDALGKIRAAISGKPTSIPLDRVSLLHTPLRPGDVIVTGTPGGVGDRREPPLLEPSDVI
jgi:hypothetical protein